MIYRVQTLWDKNSNTKDWGFLLVDAKNAFNEIIRFGILWMVRHLWPSRASFVFNFYLRWSYLVLQNGNGTASFLHSKVGVTQGGTLSVIEYGIGILPLIKNLKRKIPDVAQLWYADDTGYLGRFTRIETYFD